MPYKDKTKANEYQRKLHASSPKVRDSLRERKLRYRKRNVDYVNALKEKSGCVDCGNHFPPCVLQFDHLGDKDDMISRMARYGASMAKLKAEIAKCEIVCANCHAVRTFTRT